MAWSQHATTPRGFQAHFSSAQRPLPSPSLGRFTGGTTWFPSEDYSHCPPRLAAFFSEGRRTEDAQQSRKKKTMKTNKKQIEGTREQIRTVEQNQNGKTETPTAQAPEANTEKRLPIDTETRKKNRSLPTEKVLALLQQQDRRLWELAEVVGKWIWVSFTEQPPAAARQTLSQLGFHWNNNRQAWQHPCGAFSLGSSNDPHEKYTSHPAADFKAA